MKDAKRPDVRERLLAVARKRGIQFGSMLSWYVAERFVQRLEQSGRREALLLYGDLLLHAVAPRGVPVLWRAELLWRPTRRGMNPLKAIDDVCRSTGGDHMTFDDAAFGAPTITSKQFEVVVTGKLCNVACPVTILVTEDGYPEFKPRDTSFACVLDGDVGGRPMSCAPEWFAAKLVRELSEAGVAHLNPKAYADLHRLLTTGVIQEELAVTALVDVFRSSRLGFPPSVPLALTESAANDKAMTQMWAAFRRRAREPELELSSVIQFVGGRLTPLLDRARSNGKPPRPTPE